MLTARGARRLGGKDGGRQTSGAGADNGDFGGRCVGHDELLAASVAEVARLRAG
jgi:hypothetical protein